MSVAIGELGIDHQDRRGMRIFLTGGTGYIGAAVARAFAAAGHAVVALARSERSEERLREAGYDVVSGSLDDAVLLEREARSADAVVHAAATGAPGQDVVDAAAVRALLAGLDGRSRPLVYTSGVWILGDTGGRTVGEDEPPAPAEIVAWRVEVERRVLDAPGVRGVVVRPAVVHGAGGGIPGGMVAAGRRRGAVRHVGDGEQRWSGVHVDDLAELYLLALDAPAGTVLHGVAGEPTRVREIAEAAAAASDARVEAWPLEDARATLGAYADALALDQRVSSDVAARLGWRPRRAGILESIRAG